MPSVTGSRADWDVLSAPVRETAAGNLPGYSLEKFSKNTTAKSAALGSSVPGLDFTHSATTLACDCAQLSTYWLWLGSPVTHAWATPLCRVAHCATMCGAPW